MHSLATEIRITETGKSVARKLRKTGRIPAVVYGGGQISLSLDIDPFQLVEIFRKTGDRNTVVHLDVGGLDVPADVLESWKQAGALTEDGKLPCMVKDVQRHPVTRDLEHVDFYFLTPGQEVVATVPLEGVGKAIGMAAGGRLRVIRRELKVRCAWEKIPRVIQHDITPMDLGDFVKASQLVLPEGVKIVTRNDFNVLNVYGKRVSAKPVAAAAGKKKK
jgi:large subunit ribosomal protein L25